MSIKTVDSLIANEFEVEIDGHKVGAVFRVSGLVSFTADESGQRSKPPFEISKMVERDANSPFNAWLRETLEQRDNTERPRRNVTVVAVDDGVVTRRWTAHKAWISEVRYSEFDTASFEMVAEIFRIHYEDITEEWPASS